MSASLNFFIFVQQINHNLENFLNVDYKPNVQNLNHTLHKKGPLVKSRHLISMSVKGDEVGGKQHRDLRTKAARPGN